MKLRCFRQRHEDIEFSDSICLPRHGDETGASPIGSVRHIRRYAPEV